MLPASRGRWWKSLRKPQIQQVVLSAGLSCTNRRSYTGATFLPGLVPEIWLSATPELLQEQKSYLRPGERSGFCFGLRKSIDAFDLVAAGVSAQFPPGIPALLLAATKDAALPLSMSDNSAKYFAPGQYERKIMEGADHWVLQVSRNIRTKRADSADRMACRMSVIARRSMTSCSYGLRSKAVRPCQPRRGSKICGREFLNVTYQRLLYFLLPRQ